jgi:hypothetical protein
MYICMYANVVIYALLEVAVKATEVIGTGYIHGYFLIKSSINISQCIYIYLYIYTHIHTYIHVVMYISHGVFFFDCYAALLSLYFILLLW